jgi:hypothetical protein
MVEGFAVVGNPVHAGFIGERLMAARDIDDAEPAMAKVSPLVVIRTGIVRPAMADGIRHALERSFATGSGPCGNESSDPAHGFSVAANRGRENPIVIALYCVPRRHSCRRTAVKIPRTIPAQPEEGAGAAAELNEQVTIFEDAVNDLARMIGQRS